MKALVDSLQRVHAFVFIQTVHTSARAEWEIYPFIVTIIGAERMIDTLSKW